MPLIAPKLDTRTFEDIFREARLRIPRYTPEWDDFNESDPGITLLQLFAWMTEMTLYQMNQVPELNYIKFLQLLNMEPAPATPAVAHLTFRGETTETIARGVQIGGQTADGEPLTFETEAGLSMIRLPLAHVQVFNGTTFQEVTRANEVTGTEYRPFGWTPQVGNALYLGFVQPNEEIEPPFPQEMRLRLFRPNIPQFTRPQKSNDSIRPPAPPVTLTWEYRIQTGQWQRLNVYEDETAAFTREGYLQIEGPDNPKRTVEGRVEETCFWLRCRMVKGNYAPGQEPVVDFLRPNVVPAINLSTIYDEYLGDSNGFPQQSFTLFYRPVQPDTMELTVELEEQEPVTWKRVDDFLASGREDHHFVLQPTTGEIKFGDGIRGQIPPAGGRIVAREYRYGGGEMGNIGRNSITTAISNIGSVEVTNERAAAGGADEETIETLKDRAPRMLRSRSRAVTTEDFAALAETAGGVERATALPLAHPDFEGVDVPGAVTVVIVPKTEALPPHPTTEQLRAVARFLNDYRLLTTEVYVREPKFTRVKVRTTVEAAPYFAFDAVALAVEKAINDALDPLGFALDGRGAKVWHSVFGADFHPVSLYRVIQDVEGVHTVAELAVEVNGQPWDLQKRVTLPRDGLVYGEAHHQVRVIPRTDF